MKKTLFTALFLSLFTFASTAPAQIHKESIAPEHNTALLDKTFYQQSSMAKHAMVVTAHPLATKAAHNILLKGGNAAEAAIAAQLVLGLVEPQSSGMGGGAFALYYDASTGRLHSLDGRETAPKSAHETMFLDKNTGEPLDFFSASTSRKAIGLPGIPDLLFRLNQSFGNKFKSTAEIPNAWHPLFSEAITLAQSGFTMTPRLAESVTTHKQRLEKNNSLAYFQHLDGTFKIAGSRLQNPDYAKSLVKLRDIGPRALSPAYNVKQRPNLCAPYRQYTICSMAEPSSGGLTLLQILGMLAHNDLGDSLNSDALHLYLEASKLAFADRNHYMADPDFVKTPATLLIEPAYLAARRSLIAENAAIPAATYGTPTGWHSPSAAHNGPDEGGTTHISIIDQYGNALSMTSSIEYAFGTGVMRNGYFLNNQLTDFSFIPEKDGIKIANRAQPGKRPRSSMSPTIIFDQTGKPVMVIGSAGGSRIIGYVALRIIAMVDWGMSAHDALNMPAILARSEIIEADNETSKKVINELISKGHKVKQSALNSGLTAIQYNAPFYYGAADKRREGTAQGH